MSCWLQLAEDPTFNVETVTDTLQEPAESPRSAKVIPFLKVSAGCREEKSNEERAKQ